MSPSETNAHLAALEEQRRELEADLSRHAQEVDDLTAYLKERTAQLAVLRTRLEALTAAQSAMKAQSNLADVERRAKLEGAYFGVETSNG